MMVHDVAAELGKRDQESRRGLAVARNDEQAILVGGEAEEEDRSAVG